MNFSDNIKTILKTKDLTQADACRLTGIPTSLMSNYIKGTKSPTLTNAIKLSQALGVSLDELAGINQLLSKEESPPHKTNGEDFEGQVYNLFSSIGAVDFSIDDISDVDLDFFQHLLAIARAYLDQRRKNTE